MTSRALDPKVVDMPIPDLFSCTSPMRLGTNHSPALENRLAIMHLTILDDSWFPWELRRGNTRAPKIDKVVLPYHPWYKLSR